MKALIICSVHAVCDLTALEREAFNTVCARHGLSACLTPEDHSRILTSTTMLDVLNHLPGPMDQRRALITDYLDILNDKIWSAPIHAYKSTFATLLAHKVHTRPTGFVSDYPLLTSNLVRSAALSTNATKLGNLTTLSDPLNVPCCTAGLAESAASLNVIHSDVEVLVAHKRDFQAAQSLGMQPRFVEELQPLRNPRALDHEPNRRDPVGVLLNGLPNQQPLQAVA